MNCIFVQFYSRTDRFVDLGNGFSETYEICKNKGDFIWVESNADNKELVELPIKKGTVYVSALYADHLSQILVWANKYKDIKFIVGGPAITSDCFTLDGDLPSNLSILKCTMEELFNVPNFSQKWQLKIPKQLNNEVICFSYTINNYCPWKKCIFCSYSNQCLEVRERNDLDFEFKDILYEGPKIIRLGTDSFSPKNIRKILPNLPEVVNLEEYRIFLRATKENLNALEQVLYPNFPIFANVGLEFPTNRMWEFMNKGYNKKDVLELLHFLAKNNIKFYSGFIVGWNNLTKNDITELEDFMEQFPIEVGMITIHNLFLFPRSSLKKSCKIGETIKVGPFNFGFFNRVIDKEQIELNQRAKAILMKYKEKIDERILESK